MENKKIDFTKLIQRTFKENNQSMNIQKKNVKTITVRNSINKNKEKSDNNPKK